MFEAKIINRTKGQQNRNIVPQNTNAEVWSPRRCNPAENKPKPAGDEKARLAFPTDSIRVGRIVFRVERSFWSQAYLKEKSNAKTEVPKM
jgi:hypothetical protein